MMIRHVCRRSRLGDSAELTWTGCWNSKAGRYRLKYGRTRARVARRARCRGYKRVVTMKILLAVTAPPLGFVQPALSGTGPDRDGQRVAGSDEFLYATYPIARE